MFALLTRFLALFRAYWAYWIQRPTAQKLLQPEKKPRGCGLAGLCLAYPLGRAGHRVIMLEAAPALGEIGAGIQLGPNVSRILIKWGLKEKLEQLAVKPESISFRRFDTGDRVGIDIFGQKMEEDYGAPYYHVHRADLHSILTELAKPWMDLRLNSRVVSTSPNSSRPHVVLDSGEVVYGDMIIGADGVKSIVRTCMVEGPDNPTPTGDAAYRATFSIDEMLKDPDLKPFVDYPESTIWMGPKMHVVGYCLRGKREYNLVMLHPDTNSDESWTSVGDVDEMFRTYEGWDPRVRKIQSMVKTVLKSRLMVRLPLKTWIHPSGRVALIGDSCHPMLPYRAQGAAMAIEDAAVLANLFNRITSKTQIPSLFKAYETLRYDRATGTQLTALSLQKVFHYPDGPEQQERDKAMKQAMALTMREARGEKIPLEAFGQNPNAWVDKAKKDAQMGYDADEVVEEWWAENGASIVGAKKITFRT